MNRKRTADECFAKAEAYEECAEHLGMEWADSLLERDAGNELAKTLRNRAEHWRKIGQQRRPSNAE